MATSTAAETAASTAARAAGRVDAASGVVRRRRAELGEFLKARRARLSPRDVGLPPGGRRRTAGLRREEVALLAGVGVTWYTWLEQGRPINASWQVLDAVAQTLRLGAAERWHLYRLAEATPVRAWATSSTVPESALTVLHAMERVPAALVNTRYDVVEVNVAHERLFWEWHSRPCVHRNTLWCCLTEPTAPEKFVNYTEEIPHMVARLRAEYAKHVGDPEWEEDIRRLAELSPEFAELWSRHEVAEPAVRIRVLTLPEVGEMNFESSELAVSAAVDLRIQVYTPTDQQTWDRLAAVCADDTPRKSA